MWRGWLGLLWALMPVLVMAQGSMSRIPTRSGVTTAVFWAPAQAATQTVVLFPGGGGGFGQVVDGWPSSNNFLVRSGRGFLAQGMNVAIFGRASDLPAEGYQSGDRITASHMEDVSAVLAWVRARSSAPVWLIGTSMGTISATAAAIHFQDQVAGLVLTSSIVNVRRPGAVPAQDLAKVRVPTLVVHHRHDACAICYPTDVPLIMNGLTQAPVRQLKWVEGGSEPSGNPCEALHYHGFIGVEASTVDLMAKWIRQPTGD